MGVRKRLIGNREVDDYVGLAEEVADLGPQRRVGPAGELEALGRIDRLADRRAHPARGTGDCD